MKLLSSWMAQGERSNTGVDVDGSTHSTLSIWTEDYSIAAVWTGCVSRAVSDWSPLCSTQ